MQERLAAVLHGSVLFEELPPIHIRAVELDSTVMVGIRHCVDAELIGLISLDGLISNFVEPVIVKDKALSQLVGGVHLSIILRVQASAVLIREAHCIQRAFIAARACCTFSHSAHQRVLRVIDGHQEADGIAGRVADVDQCIVVAHGRQREGDDQVARVFCTAALLTVSLLDGGYPQIVGRAGLQLLASRARLEINGDLIFRVRIHGRLQDGRFVSRGHLSV